MAYTLQQVRTDLEKETQLLRLWQWRNKVRETGLSIFFLITVGWICFFCHFSYASLFVQNRWFQKLLPIAPLWDWVGTCLEQDSTNGALVSLLPLLATVVLGAMLAFILRSATKATKKQPAFDKAAISTLQDGLAKTKELDKQWESKPKRFLWTLLIYIVWSASMTTISTLLCKQAGAPQEYITENIFLGIQNLCYGCIIVGIFKLFSLTLLPDDMNSFCMIRKLEEQIKHNAKEEYKQQQIFQGITLFLDQKYAEAKQVLAPYARLDCGDIVAILTISEAENGKSIENLRHSYNRLWQAKDLGFYHPKVGAAVDLVLDKITPIIQEHAQADMMRIFAAFLKERYKDVIDLCEKHVAYGHPDAIVVSTVCSILLKYTNNPNRYPEWLKLLKSAHRRGISEFSQEIAEELLVKLEITIRNNQELEAQRQRRAAELSFVPCISMPGALPTWAEDSGWTDYRTGETLYRVDGIIVNGNGEEVSPAWWE